MKKTNFKICSPFNTFWRVNKARKEAGFVSLFDSLEDKVGGDEADGEAAPDQHHHQVEAVAEGWPIRILWKAQQQIYY